MMNGQLHLPVRDLVQILDLGLHWKEETSTAFVEWKGAKKTISAADLDIFYKENRTAIDSLHKSKPKPIGKYTTYFNKFNKNRTENIHLACKRLNNTVVKPGEIFSFNRATGPRGAANGYKESIIFKGGKKVLEAGGGVCQVSSTLYNAALDAGMKIVERHPHSLYVDYVPVNKDATVYYGYLDFKFKNTTPHCIQVRGDVIGNQLTASLNKIPCPYDPLQ
ncbi:MAG: VanW family protein [Clostridia bacterium]|nr:VanW family protein [Clostridia bacterium]